MSKVALWIGAFACAVAAGPSAAQQYRCPSPNGAVYLSHSPCQSGNPDSRAAAAAANAAAGRSGAGTRSSEGVRYFGPADSGSSFQPRPAPIGEAPPQLKYMSARCSALNDALRTASARGLNYETVAKMRKDYQAECAEDEREAYGRLSEEMRDKSLQKREAKMAEGRERERTALHAVSPNASSGPSGHAPT